MKKYNVGMIGYGWATGAHIAAINSTALARVTAVYSSRPQDPAVLQKKHGCELAVFSDLDAMLRRDDIHAVSICSLPHLHPDHVIAAVRAGKHFILEKPIGLSVGETRRVVAAVQGAPVRGCVCFEGRFSAQFKATKSLIDQGLLGAIHYAECDYFHGIGPWYGQYRWNTRKDAGGSSLLTAGLHAVSSLLLCMGNDVESVTCHEVRSESRDFSAYEYPTTSVTIVAFKDGRIGKVASSIDCVQPYYRHVHLVGSEGSLLNNRFHSQRVAGLDKSRWSELSFPMLDSGNVYDHPYRIQFEAYFEALARGEDMPLTSFAEALITHRVTLAADLSAAEGSRRVRLEEVI